MCARAGILPGGRVERPGGFVGDEVFRLLVAWFGTFGMAVLALTGIALAVICLSRRPLVAFLAWPAAGLGWASGRFSAAREAWQGRAKARAAAPVLPANDEAATSPASEASRPGAR